MRSPGPRVPRFAALVLTAVVLTAGPALPATAAQDTTAATFVYLQGVWRGFDAAARDDWGAYFAEALVAAGKDPGAWPSTEDAVLGHLGAREDLTADKPYKKFVRAVHALGTNGIDPRTHPDGNLIELVRSRFDGGQFGDESYVNDDIWAILALRAAGVPQDDAQVQAAARTVLNGRALDGGWSYRALGTSSGTDMTGMALAALAAAGRDVTNDRALDVLQNRYNPEDGGYAAHTRITGEAGSANCQSTVWAVHGLGAGGRDVPGAVHTFLESLRNEDGGYGTSEDAPSDFMCTTELVPVLQGARYPLKEWAPAHVSIQAGAPGDDTVFRAQGDFTKYRWRIAGSDHRGSDVVLRFQEPGAYSWTLWAEGRDTRHRASGTVTVLVPPPRVVLAQDAFTLSHNAPLTVDATASTAWRDTHVAKHEVRWGDGNVTRGTLAPVSHVYGKPGAFNVTVRVQDADGRWSAPAMVRVTSTNAAPTANATDLTITTNRSRGLTTQDAPVFTDTDGDALNVTWDFGDGTTGSVLPRPYARPGTFNATVTARDPWGATARVNVTVVVENSAPVLRAVRVEPANATAGETVRLVVDAWDADGDAVNVTWSASHAVGEGPFALRFRESGNHSVAVRAADAWGAATERSVTVAVTPASANATSAPAEPARGARPSAEPATGGGTVAAANAPPTVRFVSPQAGAVVREVDAFDVRLAADDADGRVTRVDAWTDAGDLEIAWDGYWFAHVVVPADTRGDFTVFARAIDDAGIPGDVAALTVHVDRPEPAPPAEERPSPPHPDEGVKDARGLEPTATPGVPVEAAREVSAAAPAAVAAVLALAAAGARRDRARARVPTGIVLALAALAAAGRLAFLWAPNVAPTFFIAFIAGVAYGARAGAAVGFLSMLATDLVISALHPALVANTLAMALVGVAGGGLGRVVDVGQRDDADPWFTGALAAFTGVVTIILFSLAADAVSWALFYRNGLDGFLTLAVAGLAFNLLPAAVNAAVFAVATRPTLVALRRAGLVRARAHAGDAGSATVPDA